MERRPGLDANGVPYNLERTYARYGSEGETWMRERTGVTEAPSDQIYSPNQPGGVGPLKFELGSPFPSMTIVKGAVPEASPGMSSAMISGPVFGRGFTQMAHPRPGGKSNVTSAVPAGTGLGLARPIAAPIGSWSSATTMRAGRPLLFQTVITRRCHPG